jgi:hypothetical protein
MAEETTSVTAPSGNPTPWFEAFDPEIKGHMQNRGLDKLDPAAAALEAIKAHRAAEKRLGAPADELVRFPKDPGDAAWGDVFKRLGRPDAADGYDFSPVKRADGSSLPEPLVASMRAAALKANLPAGAALQMVDAFVKHMDGSSTEAATQAGFKAAADMEALKTNWGPNYDTNLFVAKRAAEVLGIPPDAIAALEKTAGFSTTMETMRKLGVAMGEARIIQGDVTHNPAAMTVEQAQARLADLKNDQAWLNKWANGGVEQKDEFTRLTAIIVKARMAGWTK